MRMNKRVLALSMSFILFFGSLSNDSCSPQTAVASAEESGDTEEALIMLDENNFPDKDFREYVMENFDTNGDANLSADERKAVSSMNCEKKAIRNLKGIEYFTELTDLRATQNLLTEVDLTENTKLREISINRNEKLKTLLMPENLQLIFLDVSYCALDEINVSSYSSLLNLHCNDNQLTSLDVSQCTELISLWCGNNLLDSLDVSNCLKLDHLSCNDNQLTSLDVSQCTELTSLWCGNNQLSSLDVSRCPGLTDLSCNDNQLTDLDIQHNTKLTDLNIGGNSMIALDVSKNDLLGNLSAWGLEMSGVVKAQEDGTYFLDLSTRTAYQPEKFTVSKWSDTDNMPQLTNMGIVWQQKPSQGAELTLEYDLSNGFYLDGKVLESRICVSYSSIAPNWNYVEITEENFPDAAFRKYLTDNYDDEGDGKFQPGIIQHLDINDLGIQDLTGIEYFTSLATLSCRDNKISVLDLSHNTGLTWLDVSYCALRELNVSSCISLTDLHCNNNQLNSLDISQCTELTTLWCENNHLGNLDISQCAKLQEVYPDNQQIDIEITIEDDCYKASSAALLNPKLTSGNNDDILSSGIKTENGYMWIEDPLRGKPIKKISYEIPLDIRNENYSGYYDSMNLDITFINAGVELDDTEIPIDEEHFPDPVFRKCLKSNYGNTVRAGTVTELSLMNQKDSIQDLTGIEYFSSLCQLYIESGHTSLHRLDLSKNTILSDIYFDQIPLTALYLPENFPINYRLETQVTVTAVEENGRYVLDLSQYGGLDEKRIIDLCGLDGTVEGDKVYWDSKDDIPVACNYSFLTKSDYDPSIEYTEQDYLYVTLQITNNAPEKPSGKMVELTEDNFKDKEFRKYLSNQYDSNRDNEINTADVTFLYLDGWNDNTKNITSLDGIEKLNCLQELHVHELPLAGELNLSSNTVLTTVSIFNTSLVDVNVSGCPYLEKLEIVSASLTEIDLSNNRNLRNLDLGENSLTDIDISHNKGIKNLSIRNNAISSLDLSKNTKLSSLNCLENPRLTFIDCTALSTLKELQLGNSLTDLDVSKLTGLEILRISGNNSLRELDLSSNLQLKGLYLDAIRVKIDFSKLTNLQTLEMNLSGLDSNKDFEQIDLTQNPDLSKVSLYNATNLKEIKFSGQKQLVSVRLQNNHLESLDLSGCSALTELYCNKDSWDFGGEHGNLKSLKLAGASALKTLDCSNNQLSALDVSDCPALQTLYCQKNNLTTIDTSRNTALKYFECSDNPIKALDLSNNRAMLTDLNCINGSLTSLDVSENAALETVKLAGQTREITIEDLIVEAPSEIATESAIVRSVVTVRNIVADKIKSLLNFNSIWRLRDTKQSGKVRLNLDAMGDFDKSKVSLLSSGTLTETGIEWDDISDIPKKVTYNYDISNIYKLSNQKMHVELLMKNIPTQEEPILPSASPSGSPVPSPLITLQPTEEPVVPSVEPSDSPAPSPLITLQPTEKPVVSSVEPSASPTQYTSQPTVGKVANVKKVKAKITKKAIYVSWKKLLDVSGYELQYGTNKSFKNAKKVELSGNKTKYVLKKLKRKKKYYIRIRAYKTYKKEDGKTERAYGKYTKLTAKTK